MALVLFQPLFWGPLWDFAYLNPACQSRTVVSTGAELTLPLPEKPAFLQLGVTGAGKYR